MPIVELSEKNFDEILDSKEIVFLDFWAEWCAPCKHFFEIIEQASTLYPNVIFAKVNVDQESEITTSFKVMSVPHLMVMKQGVIIYSQAGIQSLSTIKELVQQAETAVIEE
jgi:thioredoxin 1